MRKQIDFTRPDWANYEVLSKNRLPARASFPSFQSLSADGTPCEKRAYSLNGRWRFRYLESPLSQPAETFYQAGFNDADWQEIDVPAQWAFSGYGNPHYTDVETIFPVTEEPLLPTHNPTGLYRRSFTIAPGVRRVILRFDGVESGFHVWINGQQVGYSQGSRCISEFDITEQVRPGENQIAVRVYQFTDGSIFEDQDMWWLAGIIRDVSLLCYQGGHLFDLRTRSELLEDGSGRFRLEAELADAPASCRVALTLRYGNAPVWTQTLSPLDMAEGVETVLPNVHPWSPETPALYDVTVALLQGDACLDAAALRIGFRSVQVAGGRLLFNGSPIWLRGVNYHCWSATHGRATDPGWYQRMRGDLEQMKRSNINTVRMSHYPQADGVYELCDELGFYVIDEADLECCHSGLYDQPNRFSDDPRYEAIYLDRGLRMVKSHRNHASILMWSLGNESGYGCNFAASAAAIRAEDPTRIIHYEEDRDADSADIYSTMYTNVEKLEELAKPALEKPHFLCEYAHAMGVSPGGLEDYRALFLQYPRLLGGCIWEWIDHCIIRTLPDGKTAMLYGGDFGDTPTNADFCADGLLLADRTPKPALAQVRHAYAPVRAVALDAEKRTVTIRNDYDFLDLSHLQLRCTAICGGAVSSEAVLELNGIAAGTVSTLALPEALICAGAEFVNCAFVYRAVPDWANDAVVDVNQFCLAPHHQEMTPQPGGGTPRITEEGDQIILESGDTRVTVSRVFGRIEGLEQGGRPLLAAPVELCFQRAPLPNDRNQLPVWREYLVTHMEDCLEALTANDEDGAAVVTLKKCYAPYARNWRIDVCIRLSLDAAGALTVAVEGTPSGELPPTLPRIGLYTALPGTTETVRWYGRGPEENYRDLQAGSIVGLYEKPAGALAFPYAMPEESGNRCDVQFVRFIGKGGSLLVEAEDTINFSLRPYSLEELACARHQYELQGDGRFYLHLDDAHHGVGSAAWGPEALEKDTLRPEPFAFCLRLSGQTEERM